MCISDKEQPVWQCIFVRSGYEDRVRAKLRTICQESLRFVIPKRQLQERCRGLWSEVLRPLFPGYILVQGQISETDGFLVNRTDKVIKVLADVSGNPYLLTPQEIQLITDLTRDGEIIVPSRAIEEGDKVVVIGGPLMHIKGLIQSINKRKSRARIVFDFMGKEHRIELAVDILKIDP